MIITLNVRCVFGAYLRKPCLRVVELDEEATLVDLHEAIQDAVHFDRDHPYGFFLAHSDRGQRDWLSKEDEWEDSVADYADTRLSDVFPTGRKRLHYLFDFGDSWTFEIRPERRRKDPEPGITYPRVVRSEGPDPVQYPSWDE
jgi:hypothetical protein